MNLRENHPAPAGKRQRRRAAEGCITESAGPISELDAVAIEAQAKRRLADEYDAAQARGEVATVGKPANVPGGNNKPVVTDLGLTRKQVHEARQIRDAEQVDPCIFRLTPAFRTTGEVCALLGVPRHVLAYWERRFTRLKPLITSGGRRHWATNDVELLQGIRACLLEDLLSIRGVQRLIRLRGVEYLRSVGRGEASAVVGAETLKAGSGEPPAA